MILSPGLRKLGLTIHVLCSGGWAGAVAAFLALAVIGLTSVDAMMVRGVYLAVNTISWWVIVPLSFASPLTGIVQALGTRWGLFRHYWVLIKLLMTIPWTAFLMLHMNVIGRLAGIAAAGPLAESDAASLRLQMAVDAGAAIMVVIVASALAVYKPARITPFGRRDT